MANWFDERAKASAGQGQQPPAVGGLSRRQVLQRGALVAGAAWTAPMLLTATPAWAGASQCPNSFYRPCPSPYPAKCCAYESDICFVVGTGTDCQPPLSGLCGNSGNGNCNGNTSRCNTRPKPGSGPGPYNTCGGPGTVCSDGSLCAGSNGSSLPDPTRCSTVDGECGGIGGSCLTDTDCALPNTGPNQNTPDLACRPVNPLVPAGPKTCQTI